MKKIVIFLALVSTSLAQNPYRNEWRVITPLPKKEHRLSKFVKKHPVLSITIGGIAIGTTIGILQRKSCNEKFYWYEGKKIPYSGENVNCPANTYKGD